MSTALHILFLDDSPDDVELEVAALENSDFRCEWERIENSQELCERLNAKTYDLIISDYILSNFDCVSALRKVRERQLDVPFIIVSGEAGESVAFECFKAGATDYSSKSQLLLLGPVVRRALREREERRRCKRAEEKLRLIEVTGRKQAEEEKRQLEEQLLQAQKMESIGRLAGGIAHDFNNLLTAIIGYSQILLARLEPNDPMRRESEEIMKAGQRAAALTSQLLAFSRMQKLERNVINLNDVIGNMVKMLRRIIGEDVEVQVRTAVELSPVYADPAQIEQVLLNLAVNARDAMPAGGRMMIETSDVTLDEAFCREQLWARPGNYVQISASDTGEGMEAERLQKIFEPFFTTKERGKGTGLGLSVVYGIIKQHDGLISVSSEPGTGTTFKIYLPIHQKEVEIAELEPQRESTGGSETILVVEDEVTLQGLTKEILSGFGYNVLLAHDGEEAIKTFRANRSDIDLVLLDLVMPRMGGREVWNEIRAMGSSVPVIFMTGYVAETIKTRFVSEVNAPLIQKPYSVIELGHKVREVLDQAAVVNSR